MNINHNSRGFTLIEIAVVVLIMGMLMSGVIALLNSIISSGHAEATRVKQSAIKAALISFVSRNNRLPCPALATLAEGATNEGVEATTPGTCTGIPVTGSAPNLVVTGVIPWVTLGLTNEGALDAQANRFTYQVVQSTTGLTSATISGLTGRITIHSAGPGILGAAPTGNQTNDCSAGATVNPCAAVAVIVSHGKDGYGAYTRAGSLIAFESSVTGNDARENANGDRMFVIKDYSNIETNPFDDTVMALTASDFLMPLITGGNIKDSTGTLKATFDIMKSAIQAYSWQNSTVTTCSGTPCRRYTLPSCGTACNLTWIAASQRTDPWGSLITYQSHQSWIDCSDSPNDPAFTLRSAGPDGINGNSDDVILQILTAELQIPINKQGCAL